MNEHEVKDTLEIVEDYPHHQPRVASETFRHTRDAMDKEGDVCMICAAKKTQKHHGAVEWAFAQGVDWTTVKGIATGKVATFRGAPVKKMLIYWICRFAEARGFDWEAFDPTDPTQIVDAEAWMVALCEEHHIGRDRGIHEMDLPHWIIQAFPLVDGFDLFAEADNG